MENGKTTEKKLGFGMMRLPLLPGSDQEVDLDLVCKMVDRYLERGFRWFDTAYFYLGGKSEGIVRKAVVERYPREAFCVADKMPLSHIKEKTDIGQIFAEQQERTGLAYFDRYLLHAVSKEKLQMMDDFGLWDFLYALKKNGKAKAIGFSFHDTAETLESILSKHNDLDFVQLQINYADWESESIQSRKIYEVARKYGLPVIIMEPVKGGMLAGDPLPEVAELIKKVSPVNTPAEWALRFAGSLEGVVTVLSGMSDMAQVESNTALFGDFQPFTAAEHNAALQAYHILASAETIPCTRCNYCTEGCPAELPIPNLIAIMNDTIKFGVSAGSKHAFAWYSRKGKPSACVQCGQCESRCPQHLPIIKTLEKLAGIYEKEN